VAGGERDHLALVVGGKALVDVLEVRRLAGQARPVVDDLEIDDPRRVVDDRHVSASPGPPPPAQPRGARARPSRPRPPSPAPPAFPSARPTAARRRAHGPVGARPTPGGRGAPERGPAPRGRGAGGG